MTKFVPGCTPCPPNKKGTHSLSEMLTAGGRSAPARLDLSHLIRKVLDQGGAGTCVGFGVNRAARTCALQAGFDPLEQFSDLHTYRQARALERTLASPVDGTSTYWGLEGLRRGGFLYESELPYDISKRWNFLKLKHGQKGLRRANVKSHRITEVPGPALKQSIMELMASGKGLVGGWWINEGFVKWNPATGPFAGLLGPADGGHCMSPIDYPNGNPRIISSWGPNVGDRGVWTVTWEFLMEAMSLWAVDFVPGI